MSKSIYNLKHVDADTKYLANIHFKTKNKKIGAFQNIQRMIANKLHTMWL